MSAGDAFVIVDAGDGNFFRGLVTAPFRLNELVSAIKEYIIGFNQ